MCGDVRWPGGKGCGCTPSILSSASTPYPPPTHPPIQPLLNLAIPPSIPHNPLHPPHPNPRAMTQFNNLSPVGSILTSYPQLSTATRLIDVGGGLGAFVGAAMEKYPCLRGAVFDLPNVIKEAEEAWGPEGRRKGMGGRVAFHGGSFFDQGAVPKAEGDSEVRG